MYIEESLPIDLFCSLISVSSVTEIQLNKLCAHFPSQFEFGKLLNVWGGIDCIIISLA